MPSVAISPAGNMSIFHCSGVTQVLLRFTAQSGAKLVWTIFDNTVIVMKPLLKKILFWGLVIDIAIAALIVAVNLPVFDQKIDPLLSSVLTHPTDLKFENNAFILMVGFAAPDTEDHLHISYELAKARYQSDFLGRNPEDNANWQQAVQIDRQWSENLPQLNCVSRKDPTCIGQLADSLGNILDANARLALLINRYQNLLEVSALDESAVQDWQDPLPDYGLITKVANIYRASLLRSGDINQLVDFIQQDTQFWRMVLKDSQLIVGKMVAASHLATLALLVNQLLYDGMLTSDQITLLESSLQTLSLSELDISNAVLAEHLVAQRLGLYLFNGVPKGPVQSALHKGFSQRVATQNDYFRYVTLPLLNILTLNSSDFFEQYNSFTVTYTKFGITPAVIYNPVGKYIVSESIESQQEVFPYSARVRDLDGLLRLLCIHFAVHSGEDLLQTIAREQFSNPYTQKPMDYDPSGQRIFFECLSKNFFECTIHVRYSEIN